MQEFFVNKIYFFPSMSNKPLLHQLKIITSTPRAVQASLAVRIFHPYGEIPSRKEKYPVPKTNKKPYRLIKQAKISYSIVSLVFGKFSCGTYQNGLNRGASNLTRSKYPTLKSTNRVSLITLVGNPYLSILLHRLWYLKNLCLEDNRSSFSRLSLKPKLRTHAHKQPFCSVCRRHDYGKTKIWRQSRWTSLSDIFSNGLLVLRMLRLKSPRYAPVLHGGANDQIIPRGKDFHKIHFPVICTLEIWKIFSTMVEYSLEDKAMGIP